MTFLPIENWVKDSTRPPFRKEYKLCTQQCVEVSVSAALKALSREQLVECN